MGLDSYERFFEAVFRSHQFFLIFFNQCKFIHAYRWTKTYALGSNQPLKFRPHVGKLPYIPLLTNPTWLQLIRIILQCDRNQVLWRHFFVVCIHCRPQYPGLNYLSIFSLSQQSKLQLLIDSFILMLRKYAIWYINKIEHFWAKHSIK